MEGAKIISVGHLSSLSLCHFCHHSVMAILGKEVGGLSAGPLNHVVLLWLFFLNLSFFQAFGHCFASRAAQVVQRLTSAQ